MTRSKRTKWVTWRLAFLIIDAIALLLIIWLVDVESLLRNILLWLQAQGWVTHVVFVVLLTVLVPLMLPLSPMELGAGILFSYPVAVLYTVLGETLGATLAFLFARTYLPGRLRRRIEHNRWFGLISRVFTREGWKGVLLSRIIPLFPFKLPNFAFGLTPISLKSYFFGTFFGVIPRLMAMVYLGLLIGDLADLETEHTRAGPAERYIIIAAVVLAVVGIFFLTRMARRTIREHLSGDSEASSAEGGSTPKG